MESAKWSPRLQSLQLRGFLMIITFGGSIMSHCLLGALYGRWGMHGLELIFGQFGGVIKSLKSDWISKRGVCTYLHWNGFSSDARSSRVAVVRDLFPAVSKWNTIPFALYLFDVLILLPRQRQRRRRIGKKETERREECQTSRNLVFQHKAFVERVVSGRSAQRKHSYYNTASSAHACTSKEVCERVVCMVFVITLPLLSLTVSGVLHVKVHYYYCIVLKKEKVPRVFVSLGAPNPNESTLYIISNHLQRQVLIAGTVCEHGCCSVFKLGWDVVLSSWVFKFQVDQLVSLIKFKKKTFIDPSQISFKKVGVFHGQWVL